ncbi:MAG: DMT family transporter [Roseburia sp.]
MKRFAALFIFLAGVLWGSMGLFVRRLNGLGLASMEIVALRAIVTAAAMLLYLLVFHREWLKFRLRDIWCFFGTGICSIVFFNFCYFKAITVTSLSVAAILLYTAPAIVMVLSRFLFGEKFTGRKLLSLVLTFFGCVLVTGVLEDTHAVSGKGILIGLGAGLGYALYSIFSRYALERGYHSMTITCYTFVVAAVASLFLSDVEKTVTVAFSDASMCLFSVLFGVLCTVVPYLLYTLGLQYMENGRASIIASVEPVTATILGVMVFRERITLTGIGGILLVLAGLTAGRDTAENKTEKTE